MSINWLADLTGETQSILKTNMVERDGRVIPETDDIALADGAVKLNATFLYADLAASSKLATVCHWATTAKIIRAYLHCCIKLIRAYGGQIRSFDGDRVMAIFVGPAANSCAVRCAREINYSTLFILDAEAKKQFPSINNNGLSIRQCVGIDFGNAVAVRAGIRNNNDLIWIGRPPSLAAKLSDIRNYPYCVFISESCFATLRRDDTHFNDVAIWEKCSFTFGGNSLIVYRTSWWRKP